MEKAHYLYVLGNTIWEDRIQGGGGDGLQGAAGHGVTTGSGLSQGCPYPRISQGR